MLLLLVIASLLLVLNGFFVLAEFSAVKMRPSRLRELQDDGVRGAAAASDIQEHLDEYLSVCQVGITFTSIGLGFAGEPAIAPGVEELLIWSGLFVAGSSTTWMTAHSVAFAISYAIVSYLHILVGELVPKSIAIRRTDKAAILTAPLLRVFRGLFAVPLWVLNGSANFVMQLLGMGRTGHEETHSEDELRILLNQSQSTGTMSFRRLLYLENVFDLGELQVRDAMRPRSQVRCMASGNSLDQNMAIARKYRFSRYPWQPADAELPTGIIHLKDLLLMEDDSDELQSLLRPLIWTEEKTLLEAVLGEMQKKRCHVALVKDQAGEWCGFLTLEDVIEEIVGTIRDEFEDEEPVSLSDALSEDRIQLNIEAGSVIEAVRKGLVQVRPESLPVSPEEVIRAVEDRERLVETYLGRQLGMPHARLPGLLRAMVLVLRSDKGIPYRGTTERAHLLFVLLTPAGQPRVHQRLQAVIATLLDESDYIPERLRTAQSASEVLEILRAGEQAALD